MAMVSVITGAAINPMVTNLLMFSGNKGNNIPKPQSNNVHNNALNHEK